MSERDNILARIREALSVAAPVPGHDHGARPPNARPVRPPPTSAGCCRRSANRSTSNWPCSGRTPPTSAPTSGSCKTWALWRLS